LWCCFRFSDQIKSTEKKNKRCSLAARIIYSNLQMPIKQSDATSAERLKRPSSLIKPLNTSSPSSSNYSTAPKIGQPIYVKSKQHHHQQQQQQQHLQSRNANIKIYNYDNDDQFPPPPPPPIHESTGLPHHSLPNPPTILQEYQEPSLLKSKNEIAMSK
jgi:hypothetical protein